ncbi:hypothetical protein P9112_012080 [Eukaryota sp. TZLM1-RC]
MGVDRLSPHTACFDTHDFSLTSLWTSQLAVAMNEDDTAVRNAIHASSALTNPHHDHSSPVSCPEPVPQSNGDYVIPLPPVDIITPEIEVLKDLVLPEIPDVPLKRDVLGQEPLSIPTFKLSK